MNRKSFTQKLLMPGVCPINANELSDASPLLLQENQTETIKALISQKV